jgi:hypothetical protein
VWESDSSVQGGGHGHPTVSAGRGHRHAARRPGAEGVLLRCGPALHSCRRSAQPVGRWPGMIIGVQNRTPRGTIWRGHWDAAVPAGPEQRGGTASGAVTGAHHCPVRARLRAQGPRRGLESGSSHTLEVFRVPIGDCGLGYSEVALAGARAALQQMGCVTHLIHVQWLSIARSNPIPCCRWSSEAAVVRIRGSGCRIGRGVSHPIGLRLVTAIAVYEI